MVSSNNFNGTNPQIAICPPGPGVNYPTNVYPGGLPPRTGPTLPGNINGY